MFSFKKHCQNTSTAPTPQGVFPWNPSFGPHIPGRPLYPRLPSRNKFGVLAADNMGSAMDASSCFQLQNALSKHINCPHTSGGLSVESLLWTTHTWQGPLPPVNPTTNSVFWQLRTGVATDASSCVQLQKALSKHINCPHTSGGPSVEAPFGPHIPDRPLYPRLLLATNSVCGELRHGLAMDANSCFQLQKALSKHINCPTPQGVLPWKPPLDHTYLTGPSTPGYHSQQIRSAGS